AKLKPVFVTAVGLMLLTQVAFIFSLNSLWGIVATLFSYFVAFNILESERHSAKAAALAHRIRRRAATDFASNGDEFALD
ncbi:hypothetical protein ACVSQ4_28085, partial [Klebsiella pneumoniae]